MAGNGNAQIEQPGGFIGPVGARAVYKDNRALHRQAAVRKYTGDEPAAQLYVIFPAGEGDVLVVQAKRSRGTVRRFLRCVNQLRGDVEREGGVGAGQQPRDNKAALLPVHATCGHLWSLPARSVLEVQLKMMVGMTWR